MYFILKAVKKNNGNGWFWLVLHSKVKFQQLLECPQQHQSIHSFCKQQFKVIFLLNKRIKLNTWVVDTVIAAQ